MLAPKRALRVAPGGSAPLLPFAPRPGVVFLRPGWESRRSSRTGKLSLGDSGLDRRFPLRIERHRAHRRPVAGPAAPTCRRVLACPLVKGVAGGEDRAVLSGMALGRVV